MRALLVLALVLLGLAAGEITFLCEGPDLLAEGEGLGRTVHNQHSSHYMIFIHKEDPSIYMAGESITVTLKGRRPEDLLSHFILQARSPASSRPRGAWSVSGEHADVVVGGCAAQGDMVVTAGGGGGDAGLVTASWRADVGGPVEFRATVVGPDGTVHTHINSVTLQEVSVGDPVIDVHQDPREFEEPENKGQGEGDGNPPMEVEEGPVEDPNEPERIEEIEREEAMAQDRRGGDHGLHEEEELKLAREEADRKAIQDELDNSEGDWSKNAWQEKEREEEEKQREIYEYEKSMAEEESKRIEILRFEIRDKEEYDGLMAKQEEEERRRKEKDENRTEKENELPKDQIIIEEEEIIIEEEPFFVKASGAASVVSSLIAVSILALLALI